MSVINKNYLSNTFYGLFDFSILTFEGPFDDNGNDHPNSFLKYTYLRQV